MLLRLLPAPASASQSQPPTILFTLAHQAHPYTSKGLPLPPNLHAHKTVCLQEDVECPNVLLGEKSSWLVGATLDVTFNMTDSTVTIELVDGSKSTHTISPACRVMLQQVCREVELSLAPAPVPPKEDTRRSLLYSLISPLLTTPPIRAQPTRYHRRQARSILVDTFRRFILPTLKVQLPPAYLPWAVGLEIQRRTIDFEGLRAKAESLLQRDHTLHRVDRYESDAESDCSSDAPPSYLATLPPIHTLPPDLQRAYAPILERLIGVASSVQSLKRLNARYSREESKRVWTETIERGRLSDRAIKRALVNGDISLERCHREGIAVEPMRRSGLCNSFTAEDVARSIEENMDEDEDCSNENENEIDLDTDTPELSSSASSDSLDACYEHDLRTPSMSPEPLTMDEDYLAATTTTSSSSSHPRVHVEVAEAFKVVLVEDAFWTQSKSQVKGKGESGGGSEMPVVLGKLRSRLLAAPFAA